MEQVRTARRAASHGSLGRRYAADPDFYPRMVSSSHPFGRPPRSVHETPSLSILASPGPLESMLKTTTETGDIGIFSIRPSRSSGTVHSGPPRPRPGYGDTNWQRPPRSNRTHTSGLGDERLRLPRYKDTASEIISMYGSKSQTSGSSCLSHQYDDMTHSSYSMTSCSSRPIQNKKSSGTLKSQFSGTYVQRPRSPFPYPTRLKRPGVRPSSPAWTENGGVDYSRMVQIDRFSHRTVHGSYKSTYPHYPRQRTPGPNRFDVNKSDPSLSSYNAVPEYQYSGGHPSSAPTTWAGRYRDRLETGRSDNSLRSSSLTSIVGMYQPASCASMGQDPYLRTQPGGSFYYDYSEDFDQGPPTARPPLAPLAPVPTRASSLHRPMVLGGTCSMHLRDTDQQSSASAIQAKFSTKLCSGKEVPGKRDDFLPPIEILRDSPSGETPGILLDSPASNFLDVKISRPSNEETQPSVENVNRHAGPMAHSTRDRASGSVGSEDQQPVSAVGNQTRTYGDKVVQAPLGSVNLEEIYEECTRTSVISQARSKAKQPLSPEASGISPAENTEVNNLSMSGGEAAGFCTHQRQHAVARFNNSETLGTANQGFLEPRGSVLPIFSPQPISPARRLRLQKSVPHLMKALDSLPNPRDSGLCFNETLSGELDSSMRFSAEYQEGGSPGFLDQLEDCRVLKYSNGRLKLKTPRAGIPRSQDLWLQELSRNSRDDESNSDREPITTDIGHLQEDKAIGLEPCEEEVADISIAESTGSVLRHEVQKCEEPLGGNSPSSHQPQPSARVASVSDIRSTFSDESSGSHKPSRGLRKRVSDLRMRLVESRLKSTELWGRQGKRSSDIGVGTSATSAPMSTTTVNEESYENKSSADGLGQASPAQSRGFRGRMSKWMTTVKQAVGVACTGPRKRG
ncbi:hypothetical protein V8F20_001554 [Naviculisporaceae sp. PSN 640]